VVIAAVTIVIPAVAIVPAMPLGTTAPVARTVAFAVVAGVSEGFEPLPRPAVIVPAVGIAIVRVVAVLWSIGRRCYGRVFRRVVVGIVGCVNYFGPAEFVLLPPLVLLRSSLFS